MNFAQLDARLAQATTTVAPAIVCRVEQGGVLLFERAYGYLEPDHRQQPTRPDSYFDLASLTKLFTTTAFLRLADAGKVAFDRPLADVIPEFSGVRPIGATEDPISKEPVPVDPLWRGQQVDADLITFRQVLTHTSGLPAWRNLYRACGPTPPPPSYPDEEELTHRQVKALTTIAHFPFAYPPGRSYVYSDIGLILLGFAVARLSGYERLDEAIEALVGQPLGLMVHFNPPVAEQPRIAPTEFCQWRQRRLRGEVHDENAAGMGGVAGHAGLFGTAADICRLGRLYLAGGEGWLSRARVQESVREQIVSASGIRRGLGWQLRSDLGPSCSEAFSPRSFGHTGYTGTSLWCDPTRDLAVALLTNRVYNGRDAQAITALRPQVHAAVVEALA